MVLILDVERRVLVRVRAGYVVFGVGNVKSYANAVFRIRLQDWVLRIMIDCWGFI